MMSEFFDPGFERIDSHQHFWLLSRGDYRWLNEDHVTLYRDFLPADLIPNLEQTGIRKTILVQAADSEAETDFLLSIAEKTPFVAGVVGWIDMQHPSAVAKLESLVKNPYFKGLRPMLQDIDDPGWMLKPEMTPVFDALVECDLSFDALIRPCHIDYLQTLLERHPGLRTVIDHAAKPDIAAGEIKSWQARLQRLSRETSVYCKLSGLVTEAGTSPCAEQISPYVDCLLDCFGPQRLMWGSDWPVVTTAMSFQDWDNLTGELLAGVAPQGIRRILGHTARDFYRIQ